MITAFWILFALALLLLATIAFVYLFVPILIVGFLALIVMQCGGSDDRGMGTKTNHRNVSHENRASRYER